MGNRPYTDDDLRAEAGRQHHTATEDPDYPGIGEQMEGEKIPSRGDFQWDELGDDDFETAMRAIDDLLGKAADVSRWAIDLGAAGLTPRATHGWISTTGGWDVAVQIATSDELTEASRDELVAEIRKALDEAVGRVLGGTIIGRRSEMTT